MKSFDVINTQPGHAGALEALQDNIFTTLSEGERMRAEHYLSHLRIFPEGQFLILDQGRPVAATTTMRSTLLTEPHTFIEISGHCTLSRHNPNGDWLYGLDLGVHPDFRGLGLARKLYRARHELCRQLGLKGQITVGMPAGYASRAAEMDLSTYFEAIKSGDIIDPTVGMQQKIGFEIIRLIPDYLHDPQCGNGGVLMILPVEKSI